MNGTSYPAPNGGEYGAWQYPPPQPPAPRGISMRAKITAGITVLTVGILGGAYYAGVTEPVSRQSAPAASQVRLEPTSSAGDNPFLATPVGTDQVGVTTPEGVNGEFSGDTEGLFAENADQASCDAQSLVTSLQTDGTKAAAWASALSITAPEIPDFVNGLNPVLLRADTAVTAHGYENNTFVPYPAVLQAGTAVFVNSFGEPTVKCYSGNPLTKAVDLTDASYADDGWSSFDATDVTYVAAAPTVIKNYVYVDVHHGGKHYKKSWCDRHSDSKWCKHKNPDKWCEKHPDSKWCKDPKPGEWCSKNPHADKCKDKDTNEEWCKKHPESKGCKGDKDPGKHPEKDDKDKHPGKEGDKDKPTGTEGDKEPGKTEPGKTEPGKTEPGKEDPTKNDPAKNEPGKDPAKTDPGKTEPGKEDPTKNDPAKNEPGKDPAKTDPGKTEPGKTDPAKTDPAKQDPAKNDPAKQDPAKNEPAKNGPAKQENVKGGPVLVKEPVKQAPKPAQGENGPVVKQPAPIKVQPKQQTEQGSSKGGSGSGGGSSSGDSGGSGSGGGSSSGDSGGDN